MIQSTINTRQKSKQTLTAKLSNRNISNMIANKMKNKMETQTREAKRNYEVYHLLNQANTKISRVNPRGKCNTNPSVDFYKIPP